MAERPIIVIGAPRSGTTLLQLMLHAHPRIAIPPENRFVLTAYRRRHEFGDLREVDNRRKLAKWLVKSERGRFHDFALDRAEVMAEIMAGPPTIGSALAIIFQAYARKFGKPRWGDKRPRYATRIDVIRRLFPTAQFVNIIRDGRDCVASLKEQEWYRPDSHGAAVAWARSVDLARRAARRLGADSFYEVRYERLVADPEAELRALCAYLGEEYDPAMTTPAAVADIIPERKTHHVLTRGPVTGARVGSWQGRLDPWEISLCESVLGGRLRAYGYELTGAPPPPVNARLRYAAIVSRRRLQPPVWAGRAYDWVRRGQPVAAALG